MIQTMYMPVDATQMMITMCERVSLSTRAGSYILAMSRIKNKLPGGVVDMVEVAQIIKYASENQKDLKPQFQNYGFQTTNNSSTTNQEPGKFTFLK